MMKRILWAVGIIALAYFFGCALPVHAQSYAGLIDNARASAGTGGLGTNGWAQAGVQGGIPSANWAVCGPIVNAGFVSSTVQSQINGCAPNTCVNFAAGTTTLTGGLHIFKNLVCGRGDPHGGTIFKAVAGINAGCQISVILCVQSSSAFDFPSLAGVNITGFLGGPGGQAQGANQITVTSASGITSGMIVLIDQCPLGMSGNPCLPVSGEGPDNGNFFDCNVLFTAPWSNTTNYDAATGGAPAGQVTFASTGHWYTAIHPPVGTAPPPSGSSSFWTDQGVSTLSTFGCAVNGPDASNQRLRRPQTEVFIVSSVVGNTITLNGVLRNPNWDLARTPQAVALFAVQNSGWENITVDMTNASDSTAAFGAFDAQNAWIHNFEVIKGNYADVWVFGATHVTVDNGYCYGTSRAPGKDSDCVVTTGVSDVLVQNNIAQYMETFFLAEGGDTGSVIAYNFMVNNFNGTNNGINPMMFPHAGDHYELYEGNCGLSYYGENFHGPKLMNTLFRNCWWGWESGANLPTPVVKNSATNPIRAVANSRYHNIPGNVLGTPGYHTNYQGGNDQSILRFGQGNTANSGAVVSSDPNVVASTSVWDNYDVTNGGETRTCGNSSSTGWVSVCGSVSEIPVGFSPFPQPLPTVGDTVAGQQPLPPSLYLANKPKWFLSLPFPLIGPDVTGGNVIQCGGALNVVGNYNGVAALAANIGPKCPSGGTGWGGHVNTNPAMLNFLTAMGGPPDGSNLTPLPFDPSFYNGTLAPPTNLHVTPNVTADNQFRNLLVGWLDYGF